MITVDMALEQGREVYAVPGRVTDALSAGCSRLIRQGAQLVTSPEELLADLQAEFTGYPGRGSGGGQSASGRAEPRGKVLELLDFQPQSMERLQEAYRMVHGDSIAVSELCYELLQLCAEGYAGQAGGRYYLKKE